MIGVIEVLWGTGRTVWMHDILVPHPRRDRWLSEILNQRQDSHPDNMSDFDKELMKCPPGQVISEGDQHLNGSEADTGPEAMRDHRWG
jgi:hypothetical protein